jgi:hypothetical protein
MKVKEDSSGYRTAEAWPAGIPKEWPSVSDELGVRPDSEDKDEHRSHVIDRTQAVTAINRHAETKKATWRLKVEQGTGVTRRELDAMVDEIVKDVLSKVEIAIRLAAKRLEKVHLLAELSPERKQMIGAAKATVKSQEDVGRNMVGMLPIEDVRNAVRARFPITKSA